jgi:Putative phage holin Dp-1
MSTQVLSNRTYDFLKYLAQIVLPGLGTLYFALAPLWDLPKPQEVVGTIIAVDTFLGLCLGLASKKYVPPEPPYDGTMTVDTTPDKKTFNLELNDDPEPLELKDRVVFKVNSTRTE